MHFLIAVSYHIRIKTQAFSVIMALSRESEFPASDLVVLGAMRTFIFAVLSTIGVIVIEMKLPDPDLNS
jgi:hypothetical protein